MLQYFQIYAHVYTAQGNRVLVKSYCFSGVAPALPPPSLVSVGNFHTLKRSFPNKEQAIKWNSGLHQKFAKGPAHHPIRGKGQLYLF